MRKFKQIILFSTLLFVALFFTKGVFGQINYSDTTSLVLKPPLVHWFYTTVLLRKNNRTGEWKYYIRPSGAGTYDGSEMDFTYDMWGNARRKRLAVGPFWNEQQTHLALNIYQLYARSSNLRYPYDANRTVYWFFIRLQVRRAGYRWKTTEAGISSGRIDEFRLSLKNGAEVGLLGLGPFYQYVEVQSAYDIFKK